MRGALARRIVAMANAAVRMFAPGAEGRPRTVTCAIEFVVRASTARVG
jgi:hypothetical protein